MSPLTNKAKARCKLSSSRMTHRTKSTFGVVVICFVLGLLIMGCSSYVESVISREEVEKWTE